MGQPEIKPKKEPKSCPNGPRVYPRSTPSRPETTQKRPGPTLGGAQKEKAKKVNFEQKLVSKKEPFWSRFWIVSWYETEKTGVGECSDNRGAREKSSVLDWKVLKIWWKGALTVRSAKQGHRQLTDVKLRKSKVFEEASPSFSQRTLHFSPRKKEILRDFVWRWVKLKNLHFLSFTPVECKFQAETRKQQYAKNLDFFSFTPVKCPQELDIRISKVGRTQAILHTFQSETLYFLRTR